MDFDSRIFMLDFLSIDDMKTAINGSNLLSAVISSDRAVKGLRPVIVDEAYFIRYAINECIEILKEKVEDVK